MILPESDGITRETKDAAVEKLSALRRFARARPQVERCELCGAELVGPHPHLLDRKSRQVSCSCDACAILFSNQQDGKYLRIPRRVRELNDFEFTDLQWEEMMVPINLAFFIRERDRRIRVMYPSPAGAIESQLGMQMLENRFASHPALRDIEPEVEALIANRIGEQNAYFIAPIDECYRMVGLIRTKWRGLSGNPEVWGAIAAFFEDLRQKASGKVAVDHA